MSARRNWITEQLLRRSITAGLAMTAFSMVLAGRSAAELFQRTDILVGVRASTVTLGDLDGDGRLDAVVTSYSAGLDRVLLGDGAGGLVPGTMLPIAPGPIHTALGDLNGDGRLDLVVAVIGRPPDYDHQIAVSIGNGNGTFGSPVFYDVGFQPDVSAIGDLDGDDRPDVAVGCYGESTGMVSVLRGLGDGTLGARQDYDVGVGANGIAIVDLDHDGIPDLLTTSYVTGYGVLHGTGGGAFVPGVSVSVQRANSLDVGDLDGDGHADFVMAIYNGVTGSESTTIDVVLGNGDGTFGGVHPYDVGPIPQSAVAGDVTGDGIPDVLGALFSNADPLALLPGSGGGAYTSLSTYPGPVGPGLNNLALGDLDADGRIDVVASSFGQGGTVSVYRNLGAAPGFTIRVQSGAHGRVAPAGAPPGSVHVPMGAEATFAIVPQVGFAVSSILVDGSPVPPATSYSFSSVGANHTLAAAFDAATPVVITRLEAESVDQGVVIRWRLARRGEFRSFTIERSSGVTGPWSPIEAELSDGGDEWVALDRGANAALGTYYRLIGTTSAGARYTFGPVRAAAGAPTELALSAAWPNPTKGMLAVRYSLPRESRVTIALLDLQGREVSILASGLQPPGRYQVDWDGRTERSAVPAGIYFLHLSADGASLVRRVVLAP